MQSKKKGDEKYGEPGILPLLELSQSRLYLHARAIQFEFKGKTHHYEAQLDDRFAKTLTQLREKIKYSEQNSD